MKVHRKWLFGEPVCVAAKICRMPGISGHADVNGLIDWINAFEKKPQKVFVTHGENSVTELFAARLRDELGYDTYAPFSGTVFDLAKGQFIYEAEGIRIQKAPDYTESFQSCQGIREASCPWSQTSVRSSTKNEDIPIKIWRNFPGKYSL